MGWYLVRDAGRGHCAFRVSSRGGLDVSWVLGDIFVSTVPSFDYRWEWLEPIRRGYIVLALDLGVVTPVGGSREMRSEVLFRGLVLVTIVHRH